MIFFLLYTFDAHASVVVREIGVQHIYCACFGKMFSEKKKKKKKNDENEILTLLALYKENAEVLNSKFSNVSTLKLKKKAKMEAIQFAVTAKQDYSNGRYSQTGGGPKPPEGPYTDLVLAIIGQSSLVLDGIRLNIIINSQRIGSVPKYPFSINFSYTINRQTSVPFHPFYIK